MDRRGDDKDFIHPVLHEAVGAIGGHYVLVGENRLSVRGRDVLYLIGWAVADASCCAPGGCSYALVPGTVRNWKYRTGRGGHCVSRVVPVKDTCLQSEIRRLIVEKEHILQVNFQA